MLRLEDKPTYLSLPRIPNSEVVILWHVDYHDGPLTGVAEWNGNRYWFDSIGEEVPDQKEFYLIRIPESEMRKAEVLQELRERIYDAGNRSDSVHSRRWKWDDLEGDGRDRAIAESDARFSEFIAARDLLPQPDLSSGVVTGWCLWCESTTASE